MQRYKRLTNEVKVIFVGIDLHLVHWTITIRSEEVELFHGSIPGNWNALKKLLDRYPRCTIQAVYEAGYFGFWLHDRLQDYGADCLVTPPSLMPVEQGNRVKTDRRDSRKLAVLLAKGLLKRVWVPAPEERFHRQVLRRRRQLIGDRVRCQNRIKAELRLNDKSVTEAFGSWSRAFVENLHRIRFGDYYMQESFHRLLEELDFLTVQIKKQTALLAELAATPRYKERVRILRTVPGIGPIAAMEILLELQDVERFRRADQLAAYVGLTPCQHSSADKVRMGRITAIGKNQLRATLIEVAWRVVAKDRLMRRKYEQLKARAGAKRAIVAVARITLLRTRRMLLDQRPYASRPAA